MNIFKIYKLEKLVQLYKDDNITNTSEQILNICSAANIKRPTWEIIDYIRGALAIPYINMIEIINSYGDSFRPDHMAYNYINLLSKEYHIPVRTVIKRFYYIDKLINSMLFKKKISAFYNELDEKMETKEKQL